MLSKISRSAIQTTRTAQASIMRTQIKGFNTVNFEKINQEAKILEKHVEIMENSSISNRLKQSDEFVYRHIGNSIESNQKALETLGVGSME
jgi:glycine dehydrogenase